MSEPDWAKVLHALHEGQLASKISSGQSFTIYELLGYLKDETNLDEDEIRAALTYLSEVGLVHQFEVFDEDEVQGALTPEGFEVAHERELKKQQQKTNVGIAFLTMILAVTAIYEVGATLIPSWAPTTPINTVLFLGFAVFVVAVVLNLNDYLDISPL